MSNEDEIVRDLIIPERALVVVAHPDDIDFGMAGTIATLTRAGADVIYCLATSGEAGPPDDDDRQDLHVRREAEQRSAAAVVGYTMYGFSAIPTVGSKPLWHCAAT